MNWTDKPWHIEQRGIEHVEDGASGMETREISYIPSLAT